MPFSSSKVEAPQITGSLFGTSSWAVSASWAPSNGGASQGVAYQTAQSGTLFDVSINTGSTSWSTRSIGGDFQPGDINVFNAQQAISGGALVPNTLLRYYKLFNTGSNPNVQQAGTNQPANYTSADRGFAVLVDTANPTMATFKGAATSSVETALINGTPGNPGSYNSASLFAPTGSIYYAVDLQRYRVLKNKALGWEDLIPSSSGGGAAGTLQSVTTAGNQTSQSISITGSLSQGELNVALGFASHAEGETTTASGDYSHAEGLGTLASGDYSHAEGRSTTAKALYSHAEGRETTAISDYAHTEGLRTTAKSSYAHAEGNGTIARAQYQHVQGMYNIEIDGLGSFVIGNGASDASRSNLLYANGSQVQISGSTNITGSLFLNGVAVTAGGGGGGSVGTLQAVTTAGNITSQSIEIEASLVQGSTNTALGAYSHAQGNGTQAIGNYSHAEGNATTTIGDYSHAEGENTTAIGAHSHAAGLGTYALSNYSYAGGTYNNPTYYDGGFAIGYGTSDLDRKNVFAIDKSGLASQPHCIFMDLPVAANDFVASIIGVPTGCLYNAGGVVRINLG